MRGPLYNYETQERTVLDTDRDKRIMLDPTRKGAVIMETPTGLWYSWMTGTDQYKNISV
ncbi:hypothetical protein LCGC14_0343580 [marine sediment metagenome]|uniref:Uncharacterized protein n=1 Tax=marine sediment metagenome TaxID=412755 RepID=A0A0F9TD18_9ZZZZ